jgi:hypothetical protein
MVRESGTLIGSNPDIGTYEFISHSGGLVVVSDDVGAIARARTKTTARFPIMRMEHSSLDNYDGVASSSCLTCAVVGSSSVNEVRNLYASIGGVIRGLCNHEH